MFGLGKIAKSVTGIAKAATGNISDFRGVLSGGNFGALGLLMPPQVQLGLKVASMVGIKPPSLDVIQGKVMSELDKAVFGAYRPNSDDLVRALRGEAQSTTPGLNRYIEALKKAGNPLLDKVDLGAKTVEEAINSIDWLL
jgi:hypothetical protein